MSVGADRVRQHIVAVARRDDGDYEVLAVGLHSVVWPDGGGDRRHPDAQGWFDRYMSLREAAPAVVLHSCSCARGHCRVCN